MSNGYRTLSQHLNDLKKENFSLKLRIYFLEERMQQKYEASREDIYKRVSARGGLGPRSDVPGSSCSRSLDRRGRWVSGPDGTLTPPVTLDKPFHLFGGCLLLSASKERELDGMRGSQTPACGELCRTMALGAG